MPPVIIHLLLLLSLLNVGPCFDFDVIMNLNHFIHESFNNQVLQHQLSFVATLSLLVVEGGGGTSCKMGSIL